MSLFYKRLKGSRTAVGGLVAPAPPAASDIVQKWGSLVQNRLELPPGVKKRHVWYAIPTRAARNVNPVKTLGHLVENAYHGVPSHASETRHIPPGTSPHDLTLNDAPAIRRRRFFFSN